MNTTTQTSQTHRDCEKDPCQLCARRQRGETCGSCFAGICIMNENEVHRCDVCALFDTDEDAADAVRLMLELLHKVYKRGLRLGDFTVADAAQVLRMDVLNAPVLRRRAAVILSTSHDPKHTGEDSHQQLIDFAHGIDVGLVVTSALSFDSTQAADLARAAARKEGKSWT